MARFIGSYRNSLARARPPKSTMASGALNATKSAKLRPRIVPVNSKRRRARASPALAASKMSLELMLSRSRREDGSSVASSHSRAVRAMPIAEQ